MNLKDKTVVIDNKTYRYSKIVMLATHEDISSIFDIPIIKWHDDNIIQSPLKNFNNNGLWLGQHLYFLSADKICEEDCFLGLKVGEISEESKWVIISNQNKKDYIGSGVFGLVKKIIASTDPSLNLPKPSDLFLQVYIDAYNKGEKIEECLVEYEDFINSNPIWTSKNLLSNVVFRPKVTKGKIIIRKVKESQNKEEVANLLIDAMGAAVKNDR